MQLVEAAREQGADVRERCTVEALLWRAGRVAGVRYRDADGDEREIAATLVVGADGRRSTVAALVGSWTPYRVSRNGRGLVFRYLDDPRAGTREAETYYQWREGDSFAFAFPTRPAGRLLILFMGHRDEVARGARGPRGLLAAQAREHPGLARADRAARRPGPKLRSTGETPAFFRASSGPGWALAGDAGHFKDPVTGQGMRDAMCAGRTLAEHVLPVLDDPAAVDRATRAWEAARDRECLPAYHFANADTRVERQSPALCELVRDAGPHDGARPQRPLRPRAHAAADRAAAAPRAGARRGAAGAASARAGRRSCAGSPTCAPSSRSAASARRALPLRRARSPAPSTRAPCGRRRRAGARGAAAAGASRRPTRRCAGGRVTRIAVVQPALALGEVERNLARIEDLIRDAHREHARRRRSSCPRRARRRTSTRRCCAAPPRPVDGQPFQLLTRLARELGLRRRAAASSRCAAAHAYGTYVLAEPDGAVHLHDKDIPTAWEQNYYVGGDDDGVVRVRDARLRPSA